MAKLTRYIASLDLYQSSTLDSITSNPDLPGPESYGARIDGLGGKEFTLAVAGASNLVAGNLLQEPAENTGLENAAVATAAAAISFAFLASFLPLGCQFASEACDESEEA